MANDKFNFCNWLYIINITTNNSVLTLIFICLKKSCAKMILKKHNDGKVIAEASVISNHELLAVISSVLLLKQPLITANIVLRWLFLSFHRGSVEI